jgi:acyl-CoA synthetase (AMP-forming)/AMP-acid ligase II
MSTPRRPIPTVQGDDDLPRTFGALVRRQAQAYGDKVFLATEQLHLTYAEVEARSRRLARALLAAGVRKGEHVGMLMPNNDDFVVSVMAATRIGAVILPFSTLSSADELRTLLANSDTNYLIAATSVRGRDFGDLLPRAIGGLDLSRPPQLRSLSLPWLKEIWFRGPLPDGWDEGFGLERLEARAEEVDEAYLKAVEARVSPSDCAVMIHTSGSTGQPKGVMHAHAPLIRHRDNMNLVRGVGDEQVLFSPVPWFWVAGFANAFLSTFISGGRVVTTSGSPSPAALLDLIERERPNITNGYPPAAGRLAADPSFAGRDFSFIRRGNLYALSAEDVRPADPGLRVETYGLTEAGSGLTAIDDESDLPERQRGSNGRFSPGFDPRIVDPETGADQPAGEPGELWIRGPFMMLGYYGKLRSEAFDQEGWYHTHDVGVIDADGHFMLRGRLTTMIKTNWANVSPREVETALAALTDGRPCIALGVPDPERGQLVAAVVIADEEIDEAALKAGLADKISSFKVPRRILRITQGELPTLNSGKVDLPRLTALVQARW